LGSDPTTEGSTTLEREHNDEAYRLESSVAGAGEYVMGQLELLSDPVPGMPGVRELRGDRYYSARWIDPTPGDRLLGDLRCANCHRVHDEAVRCEAVVA
jgi:hypothetical protein